MHQLVIRHSMGHNFIVEAENQTVLLSYKGAGGRSNVTALGDKGISDLVSMAHTAMLYNQDPTAIRSLYCALGCKNALLLLESFYPNEWIQYWTRIVSQRKLNGQGCSFRAVLQEVSGSRSTLAHYPPSDMLQILHNICGEASRTPLSADHALPLPNADCAESNGIVVKFMFKQNNMLLFDVNGHTIPFCTNRVHNITSATDLLRAAYDLKHVVQNQGDLASLTSCWGGTFVFRLLGIICPQDTIRYIKTLAQQAVNSRTLIEPRKFLSSFNFSCNDSLNHAFTEELLAALEQFREESIPHLIDGNTHEILSRNDKWTLFFDRDNVSFRTIQLDQISDPHFRTEAVAFLRDIWCSSGSISVIQFVRYYYLLRDGLNALSYSSYMTLSQLTIVHARLVKTYLERTAHKTANCISETLQVLGRLYAWANLTHNSDSTLSNNPFNAIEIPNKRAFLRTTTPADFDCLALIQQHSLELPEHIRLAHDLLLLTSCRSNDILRSSVKNYCFLPDGTAELSLVTSKNGRPARFQIPLELALRLSHYIERTAAFRAETGQDFLFLYQPTGLRDGSLRRPRLLTYNTYNFHINDLLNRYAPGMHITARQIRAESGRRYHHAGYSSSQTAIALTNTPQVAARHYRSLSVNDEAHLYHQLYLRCFSDLFSPSVLPVTSNAVWGQCRSSSGCRSTHDCSNCPFISTTEVINNA